MEKANKLIFKEYTDGFKMVSEGKPISEVFPNLSIDLIKKLNDIRKFDTNVYKPEKTKRR